MDFNTDNISMYVCIKIVILYSKIDQISLTSQKHTFFINLQNFIDTSRFMYSIYISLIQNSFQTYCKWTSLSKQLPSIKKSFSFLWRIFLPASNALNKPKKSLEQLKWFLLLYKELPMLLPSHYVILLSFQIQTNEYEWISLHLIESQHLREDLPKTCWYMSLDYHLISWFLEQSYHHQATIQSSNLALIYLLILLVNFVHLLRNNNYERVDFVYPLPLQKSMFISTHLSLKNKSSKFYPMMQNKEDYFHNQNQQNWLYLHVL